MSDIRGYSTIAEHADPAALAAQLNTHRAEMNRAIIGEGGTVMQYVGDAVMAVFGAPVPSTDHADRALAAALAMHAAQAKVNQVWLAEGLAPFGLGLGLSTGEVAAALLGSEERVEYTVVGDAVNLSQRLQQFAEPGQTVLSEATWAGLTQPAGRRPGAGAPAGEGPGHAGPVLPHRPRRCRCLPARSDNMTLMDTDSEPLDPASRSVESPASADAPADLAVSVRAVYRTFEQDTAPVRALRGADLDLRRGEFVAVMGPSGCGKSTLLNLVAGLDVPDEGTIEVAGESIVGLDENKLAIMRRKHIGIVFQFFNLLEGMTVLENVVMPAVIAGMKRKPAEARARDLLDLLGLGDKARQAPGVAVGRPAPAPRHRPGAGQRADRGAGRRAHRRPRQRRRGRGARAVPAPARRRPDDPARHPRPAGRRRRRADRADEGRPRRRRRHRRTHGHRLSLPAPSTMVALRLWVVSEWRRRWASLLLVAMIVAIGGGAVLLSLNGARRADTAFARFFDRVGAPNVEAEASLPESGDLGRFAAILDRLDDIDALPGVERAFVSAWMLVGVKGQSTGYFTPVPIVGTDTSDAWQSVVVEGRIPARDEADVIVVNEEAVRVAGVGVGDRLTLESLAPGQGLEYLRGDALPEPRGPSVDVTIVGVVRGAEDISDTPEPYWAPGEGFYRAYGDQIETCVCRLDVRAEPGRQGEVVAAVAEIVEPLGFSVRAGTGDDLARRLEHATSVEANLLRVAAVLAAGAGLLLLVLALLRQEAELSNELQVRRALGLGARWHAGGVGRARPALRRGGCGRRGGARRRTVAVPSSGTSPPGRGRPGRVARPSARSARRSGHVGGRGLVCSAVIGWMTSTRSAVRSARPARRAVPGLLGALPVPASLGVGFAVDPGRGRLRIASLSGVAGVALAVAAAAGVATLRSSTDRAGPLTFALRGHP